MGVHARLSASRAHRWMACPASIQMEADLPEGPVSEYALEGTCAHNVAERALKQQVNAEDFIGQVDAETGIEVTQEMANYVQEYIDYVRNLKGELFIEQAVDYSEWVPEGFGTADAIVLHTDNDEDIVTVVDLKYGKGNRVDVEDNPQLKLYALGALYEYELLYACDKFRLVIHQPRLDNISEWEISREDLLEFAKEANQVALEIDQPNPRFNPGESQCKYCAVNAVCKARAEYNLKIISDDFAGLGEPIIFRDVHSLSNDEIGRLMDDVDNISSWAKSLEARAQSELEHGREIPGYKLVAGKSKREWSDETEAEEAMRKKGADDDVIFEKKMITAPKAEKHFGKKKFAEWFIDLVNKAKGKPTIAKESDKRPAISTNVADDFKDIE